MVCRVWEYPTAGLWPFSIRDDLPQVPVPLVRDIADVVLPLKPCLDRAYDEGRYETDLHYDRSLTPRLRKSDVAWLRKLLADRLTGKAS
jgi:hypothetical protein